MPRLTRDSTLGEIHAHPMGRDVIDKILLQLGRSRRWITNPVARRLRLGTLEKWAETVAKLSGETVDPGFFDVLLQLLNQFPEPVNPQPRLNPKWWHEAVFYQIYPRSFADSNGDGIGDLCGIIEHLDHFVELGIDCLWLSPIFASPNQDNGYDVSDYREIMAEMGTLADVDELIASCHRRGIRIILDLVVNHTSEQHPWFLAAQADPTGPFGQYYFLREASPDTPPNNWTSFFSGPAWRWLPDAQHWALHLFADGQLDLNWENPALRAEVAEIVSWWLARGVDGFRLDVINYISKTPGLPDGNKFVGELMGFTGVEHYFHGPRLHEYLAELRREGFTRQSNPSTVGPGKDAVAVMIGETPGIGMETGRLLTAPDRGELDLIFNFDHLETPGMTRWDDYRYQLPYLKAYYIEYLSKLSPGEWLSIYWDNHDNPRMLSKVNPDPKYRSKLAKALATIQLMLRGTPFIYQGQEIAAINQAFPDESALRDIESINKLAEERSAGREGWQSVLAGSRDHARTPMRWNTTSNQGFTTGDPWIYGFEDSQGFTVEEQLADPDSVFSWYRELIRLRRANPALTRGEIEFVTKGDKNYFGWFRKLGKQRWLIEVNLSAEPIRRPLQRLKCRPVMGGKAPRSQPMAPYEARLYRVSS